VIMPEPLSDSAVGAMRATVKAMIEAANGVLRLDPSWVARDWLPAGHRLGLPESAYDLGERGSICERWVGRAKIFDYGARIPYHVHPQQRYAALVGCKPKDEAFYFPPRVDLGAHPESFFGVHPWIALTAEPTCSCPYLQDWNSDRILKHAWAEPRVPDEGFDVPSGVLHAPSTALTVELQEDSDVLAMFQALNAGTIISKDLLFTDVRRQDREEYGESFPLWFVDWELNGDPSFDKNRHPSGQPPAAGPAGRRAVLDLLQHQHAQRKEARGPAGWPLHDRRARCVQPPGVERHRHLRRPAGDRWRCPDGRAARRA